MEPLYEFRCFLQEAFHRPGRVLLSVVCSCMRMNKKFPWKHMTCFAVISTCRIYVLGAFIFSHSHGCALFLALESHHSYILQTVLMRFWSQLSMRVYTYGNGWTRQCRVRISGRGQKPRRLSCTSLGNFCSSIHVRGMLRTTKWSTIPVEDIVYQWNIVMRFKRIKKDDVKNLV